MTLHRTFNPWCACFQLFFAAIATACGPCFADGRLLATGGVTDIDGSAGGGIVPWAVIAGYETRDEIGFTAFATDLDITHFRLRSMGLSLGIHDTLELSLAHQQFDLGSTVPGAEIRQDVIGIKLKLSGDAVFDQDSVLPQVAVGAQYKQNLDFTRIPQALGAHDDAGTDFYVAATKLYLAGLLGHNVLLDATLTASRANQLGLLGFGGNLNTSYRLLPSASAAVFINDHVAAGLEYRAKPNNLSAFREQGFGDVFLAYLPNKYVSVTAAFAQLGQIADKHDQSGLYLSVQVTP